MCRMRNIAMRDHQESVTTGQTPDKVIPMCRYALGKGHATPYGNRQQLCEILSRSNTTVRRCGPVMELRYTCMCIVTLTLEI